MQPRPSLSLGSCARTRACFQFDRARSLPRAISIRCRAAPAHPLPRIRAGGSKSRSAQGDQRMAVNWELQGCCHCDQRIFIAAIGVSTVVILLLWRTFLLTPFKLIIVFLHETSHALACRLTCGDGFSRDAGLAMEAIHSLSASKSSYPMVDLTQLFMTATQEGKKLESQGQILRVVTRSVDPASRQLSSQKQKIVDAIVKARWCSNLAPILSSLNLAFTLDCDLPIGDMKVAASFEELRKDTDGAKTRFVSPRRRRMNPELFDEQEERA
ncbi:hypothetical protein Zm00014a_033832 [Zea mays]|uniref:Uncharacterized protein n=1 Tax=Zea mays TaxID=4577 RepID=A0A3L6G8M0_MAIZE|nr:hypothetical protein Zm00014a_033832 [Zea mays]